MVRAQVGSQRINSAYESPQKYRIPRMCVRVSHTTRPRCPATRSSGRLPGQCWEGPPGSPSWRIPGRTGAWRGRPSGSLYAHNFLRPFPTSQELHRSLWLGTPALPHCWWSLWPCLWGTDPRHLRRGGKWEFKLMEILSVCCLVSLCTHLFVCFFTYCHSSMIWWSGWPDSAEWMMDWVNPHHQCHHYQRGQAPALDLKKAG